MRKPYRMAAPVQSDLVSSNRCRPFHKIVHQYIEYSRIDFTGGIHIPQKPFTSVLFDMDNTLFDLYTAKMMACRAVTSLLGRGNADDLFSYFLRKVGGFEDPANIRDFMIEHGCYDPDLFSECTRVYDREKLIHITLYDGVSETLGLLKQEGFKMAVVTDAYGQQADLRLRHTGLGRFFDTVVTVEMTGSRKPSTLPFLYALLKLNARAEETVVVGDSPRRDIAPGNILGMRTVYARYGDRFSVMGEACGADYVLDDFRDLPGIIGVQDRAGGLEHSAIKD
jgi:putative hydrolase of the HAD superfamily